MRTRHRDRGFTLAELLVGLAIGATLVVLAVPGYRAWIVEMEIRDRVEALIAAMSLARAEAIKRGSRVNLCPSADGAFCSPGGQWEMGWLIFADDNHDGERDNDETILRVQGESRPGITVRGNKPVSNYVSYTAMGHTRMVNGALQMGTFTICRNGSTAVDVILANGGRVRVDRPKRPCP